MPKVAIIEDDAAVSQLYRFKFEAEGFEVETAENGKLGLELIEKSHPDIVLLDIIMPVMNGDEMLSHLRQTPWGKDMKVIVLTNMAANTIPPSLKDLGVSNIVTKANMPPREVAQLVKEMLDIPSSD